MKPFQLAKGNTVPNLEGIHACYEVVERTRQKGEPYYSFAANVGMETLPLLLEDFCRQLDEPCFFLCELGATKDQEEKLRQSEDSPYHRSVYYKDGCSREELLSIWRKYGEWFVEDGMSCFGFASHRTADEIYVGKYKIVNLFTKDLERYEALLKRYQIPREESIKTVWNNFTREQPGECRLVTINGKTVYDIVDELLKDGLYFAEFREEA